MGVHIFLQVPVAEFEDKNEFCLGVNNVVKANDIDMLELLHKGDFADRSRRSAFLSIEVDLFQSYNLVRRP